MRIVFSGAAGIGKTTLAKATAEHYGLFFFEERFETYVSSLEELKKAKITRDRHLRKNDCKKILISMLEQWERETRNHSAFVSDRSPLDVLLEWNQLKLNVDQSEFTSTIDYCTTLVKDIDLFFIPPFARVTTELKNEAHLNRGISGEEQLIKHSLLVGLHELFVAERTINMPLQIISPVHRFEFVKDTIQAKNGTT
jgi:hypothetical protein